MRDPTPRIPDKPLCRLSDLPLAKSKGFDPLGEGLDTMFIVRHGQGVVGYRNACPHYDYARMAWRKDEFLTADGTQIRCAAHGALFRIPDGVCESGPCLGQRLTSVPLEIHDDEVWIAEVYAPGRRRTKPGAAIQEAAHQEPSPAGIVRASCS